MLTFYYARQTCALASHLALEHAGADYQAQRIDFASEEQRAPHFLRINPKGRVPALVTDRGILTETPAILQYIGQTHPASGLAPADPFDLARMNAFNSWLCSTVHVNHAHKGRGYRWADDPAAHESMKKKVTQNMADCFAMIENDFLQGPWVLGEPFSAADFYLFTIDRWLEGDGVDVKSFPRVVEHMERVAAMPAVKRVLEAQAA